MNKVHGRGNSARLQRGCFVQFAGDDQATCQRVCRCSGEKDIDAMIILLRSETSRRRARVHERFAQSTSGAIAIIMNQMAWPSQVA